MRCAIRRKSLKPFSRSRLRLPGKNRINPEGTLKYALSRWLKSSSKYGSDCGGW